MRFKPMIIIAERAQWNTEWRRFVAILCFLEFYGRSVTSGSAAVLQYFDPGAGSRLHPDAMPWPEFATLLKAVALFAVGRALWFAQKRLSMWLVLATAADLLDLVGGVQKAFAIQAAYSTTTGVVPNLPALVFSESLLHLSWWFMLSLGAWHVRKCPHRRSRSWVVFAAIWAAGGTVFNFVYVYNLDSAGRGWFGLTSNMNVDLALQLSPLILSGALLMHWVWSRTAALLLAMIQALANLEWAFVMIGLVGIAIKALFIAYNVEASPWRHVIIGKPAFNTLCVDLPANVGPWLLIAWYAWRVPMKALPDDGSPYPRRYCGKCFYNLHGLETGQCPECGAKFENREPSPGIRQRDCEPSI